MAFKWSEFLSASRVNPAPAYLFTKVLNDRSLIIKIAYYKWSNQTGTTLGNWTLQKWNEA